MTEKKRISETQNIKNLRALHGILENKNRNQWISTTNKRKSHGKPLQPMWKSDFYEQQNQIWRFITKTKNETIGGSQPYKKCRFCITKLVQKAMKKIAIAKKSKITEWRYNSQWTAQIINRNKFQGWMEKSYNDINL